MLTVTDTSHVDRQPDQHTPAPDIPSGPENAAKHSRPSKQRRDTQWQQQATASAVAGMIDSAERLIEAELIPEARQALETSLEITLRRLWMIGTNKRACFIEGIAPLAKHLRTAHLIDRPTLKHIVKLADGHYANRHDRGLAADLLPLCRVLLGLLREIKPKCNKEAAMDACWRV